ncbi:TlpA family protein disulfide reductase [Flavivirga eckloniae]|uniref:Thioredoxin domain-containing protein n=1 Tax=Flavivirga eckloniae TaxID=1803846 RepID=A0A2K9PNL0_9FLAO|nr:TlpA disulfide reductase family protein [Flavivirga eckloniae]AUP78660.1 hypothetical protein C1H87_08045 [Flavivirga eckloniae]
MKKNIVFLFLGMLCASGFAQGTIEKTEFQFLTFNQSKDSSMLPKELEGSWMLADGSNRWDYGFYPENAIVDKAVWNYNSVDISEKKYTITLERKGQLKVVHAVLNKNGQVDFDLDPRVLKTYSTERIYNPEYKSLNNDRYTEADIKHGFTTYSGYIKNFAKENKSNRKTGSIKVSNVFTGSSKSHVIEIKKDGSFSIKFPVPCPTHILVEIPYNGYHLVFVEPGKEVFHLIHKNNSKFMEDGAQVNSGLNLMKSIMPFSGIRGIGEMPPEDYKRKCFENAKKLTKQMDSITQKQFICNKALQLKRLHIEFTPLFWVTNYEIKRFGFGKRNELIIKDEAKKIPIKEFKVDDTYYHDILENVLDNKIAVLSRVYYDLIFRLKFCKAIREHRSKPFEELLQMAEARQDNMAEFLNVKDCFMLDLITCQGHTRNPLKLNPYTNAELKNIKREIKTPFLSNYLTFLNDNIKEEIEVAKSKNRQTEYAVNKVHDDEVFQATFGKYKGKVVYVGFWRTYCGPCLTGMERIKPLKETLKNEDVVFLYIVESGSDEKTWKKLIADIDGEHLRVSHDEWAYLASRFGVAYFPHYALINKKGEIVNPQMKFNPTNDELMKIFKSEM